MSELLALLLTEPVLNACGQIELLSRALLDTVDHLLVKDLHRLYDEAYVSLLMLRIW